jgi:hypothetical protein
MRLDEFRASGLQAACSFGMRGERLRTVPCKRPSGCLQFWNAGRKTADSLKAVSGTRMRLDEFRASGLQAACSFGMQGEKLLTA